MSVQKLPKSLQSYLESGSVLTDATQCVLELVYNALDAEATAIAVGADLKKYRLQVIDNGYGITRSNLELIGKRYMTSKCRDLKDLKRPIPTYGYRGQAIASMLDACTTFSITTKSDAEEITLEKEFIHGKAQPIQISVKELPSTGTSIFIDGFMSTMPVRQKRIIATVDIADIKAQLEFIAVIHSHVAFSFRDDNSGLVLLQTKKKANALFSFSELFDIAMTRFLVPLSYQDSKYKISGFVSNESSSESTFQFVYVNKRIIHPCNIHKFVNNVISINFKKLKVASAKQRDQHLMINLPNKTSHNVFLIQIHCPYREYDISHKINKTRVQFKNIEEVFKCIYKAFKSLLKNVKKEDTPSQQEIKVQITRKIMKKKGEEFGTSQLVNAVRGAPVKRKPIMTKGVVHKKLKTSLVEEITNKNKQKEFPFKIPDTKNFKKVSKVCTSESVFSKKEMTLNKSSKGLSESPFLPSDSSVLACENAKTLSSLSCQKQEGSLIFFHEFLEWIDKKTKSDFALLKLCKEFLNFKYGSTILSDKNMKKILENNGEVRNRSTIINPEENHSLASFLNANSNFEVNQFSATRIISKRKLTTPNTSDVNFKDFLEFRNDFSSKIFQSHQNHHPEILKDNKNEKNEHCFTSALKIQEEENKVDNRNSIDLIDQGCQTTPNNTKSQKTFKEKSVQVELLSSATKTDAEIQVDLSNEDKLKKNEVKESNDSPFKFEESSCLEISLSDKYNENNNNNNNNISSNENNNINNNKKMENNENNLSGEIENIILADTIPVNSANCFFENESNFMATTECSKFSCSERYLFVPKTLSPILLGPRPTIVHKKSLFKEVLKKSKHETLGKGPFNWESLQSGTVSKPLIPNSILSEMHQEAQGKMMFYESDILSASVSKSSLKVHNLLRSFSFKKELLSNIKVLGQLDKKFIVVLMAYPPDEELQLLTLFDQHAVDERVTLEKLMIEYKSEDGNFTSLEINPPITISLNETKVQVLKEYKEKLMQFGFIINDFKGSEVIIGQIPKCLMKKDEQNAKNNYGSNLSDTIKNFMSDLVEELIETRGSIQSVPKLIHDFICTQACRRAIKFNQSLTTEEMEEMLRNLKECDFPFQCAHGRPSLMPLLDLRDFVVSIPTRGKPCWENLAKYI